MESFTEWSDPQIFETYDDLRRRAEHRLRDIDDLLKEAKKISLDIHPSISGEAIGFPAEVSPRDYLEYVSKKMLPSVKSTIEKLDAHLRGAKKA